MHSGEALPLVDSATLMREALFTITSKGLGITGVTSPDGALIGVITDGDLRRAFTHGFHERPANEVMGKAPRIIAPDELAQAALARMNAEGITSLFVLDEGRVIGVLHVHDLLRAGLV